MAGRIVIIGGGAAGIFAAIRAATLATDQSVVLLEKSSNLLQKVSISGGGRCNITHDCRDPRALVASYPRGSRELRGMFARFAAQETIDWFDEHGVRLKTEADGRMFPVTDQSATVIDCLVGARNEHPVLVTMPTLRTRIPRLARIVNLPAPLERECGGTLSLSDRGTAPLATRRISGYERAGHVQGRRRVDRSE